MSGVRNEFVDTFDYSHKAKCFTSIGCNDFYFTYEKVCYRFKKMGDSDMVYACHHIHEISCLATRHKSSGELFPMQHFTFSTVSFML